MTRDDLVTMLGHIGRDLEMGDVAVAERAGEGRLAIAIRRPQSEVDRIREALEPHIPMYLDVCFMSTIGLSETEAAESAVRMLNPAKVREESP